MHVSTCESTAVKVDILATAVNKLHHDTVKTRILNFRSQYVET